MDFITDKFLIWWLRRGRYWWSKLRRRLFEWPYRRVQLPAADSLREIEACLKQVKWTADGPLHLFDSISYPQVTWSTKKDDCDGFASLAAELVYRLNPACNPLLVTALVHPIQASHTVCAFTSGSGRLSVFDNNSLKPEEYPTFSDVVLAISKNSRKLVCWDVRKPDTFELVKFHKL